MQPGFGHACPPDRPCLPPLPPLLPCHPAWLQGGASSQFSAIPLNLAEEGDVVDYIVTGSWSKKAAGGEHSSPSAAACHPALLRSPVLACRWLTCACRCPLLPWPV